MINKYKNINILISGLFIIFPFLMITGPAIPDIFISLCSIYGLFLYIFFKKYREVNENFFIFLLLFWLICVFSSLFSDFTLFSLESSLPYLRFTFFTILIFILAKNYQLILTNYIFIFITSAVVFVTFDTYLQFFLGNEIFGHKITPDQNRLTGPFRDDERVVGSYLSRFIFPAFGFLLFKFNTKTKALIPFCFLLLVYLCIFLSGERMALILTSFGICLVILFNLRYFKYFILLIISILFLSTILLTNYDKVRNRVINTTLQVIGYNFENGMISKYEYSFLDSHYGAHYLTAFEIYKDNLLLGTGPKTFRIVCANDEYSKLDSYNIFQRCSTHPHNYYLQILSETGSIGMLLFLISFMLAIKYLIKHLNIKNPIHNCTLISLLIFLWPIQSTGSIFNNWYGAYIYYYLCLIIILSFEQKKLISRPSS